MKKVILTLLILTIGIMPALAQTLDDYISETRGDTLVVKTRMEMQGDVNALYNAITLDTVDVPESRVYLLKRGGRYPLVTQIATPTDRKTRIVGEGSKPMVQSQNDLPPATIVGAINEDGEAFNNGLISFRNDLLLKNLMYQGAAPDGSAGWSPVTADASGCRVTFDNVYHEHNKWVLMDSNGFGDTDLIVKDSYLVNLLANGCRRNGGLYDNVGYPTDTIWVENTTFINNSGIIVKPRDFGIGKLFFNHNTFVNCPGQIIGTAGYHSDMVVTNNLFVNSNCQGYREEMDVGETDRDGYPQGIINIDTLTAGYDTSYAYYGYDLSEPAGPENRKVLVDKNGVYWDPRLDQIVEGLESQEIDGYSEWTSMAMTMNERTQNMFDSDDYPYLVEGNWVEAGDPEFTDPHTLMSTMVDSLIAWCIVAGGDDNGTRIAAWRTDANPADENWTYPDWPVPADLSYSNSEYLTAGINGFPLGDLNWFSSQKEAWSAQREAELQQINDAQDAGELVGIAAENGAKVVDKFVLNQNYPNPFNPTTSISYKVRTAGKIKLKVYNALGQEVAVMDEGFKTANSTGKITFDGSNLSSGIYVYSLVVDGNPVESRKMVLIK